MASEEQTNLLNVSIQSPDETIWEGQAYAVSSENDDGPFDILPGHANFITICIDSPLTVHLQDGSKKEFSFERFTILNQHDTVSVYAEV